MSPPQWIEQVESGHYQAELSSLRLFNSKVSCSGQGMLAWDCHDGVRLEAFTNGRDSLRNIFGHEPCKPGHVLPSHYYVQLAAETRDGWDVEIKRILPDYHSIHAGNPTVVWRIPHNGIYSTVKLERANVSGLDNVSFALFHEVNLRSWPRASTSVYENPHFGTRIDKADWLEFDGSVAKVVVQQRSNYQARVMIEHKTQAYEDTLNGVRLAFSLVVGSMANIVAAQSFGGSHCHRYLKWPSSRVRSGSFDGPLGAGDAISSVNPEPLLRKAADFFAAVENNYIGNLLYACLDSTDNTFTTHAMVVAVATEGLVKRISRKPPKQKKEISNVLKDWATKRLLDVEEEDEQAWRRLRNPTTHGDLLFLEEPDPQGHVSDLSRVKTLFNKLILQFLDYDGPYFDYSTWQFKDFPKANPAEL